MTDVEQTGTLVLHLSELQSAYLAPSAAMQENEHAFVVELVGDALRFLQTGNVRNYALTFLLGIVALLLIVLAG